MLIMRLISSVYLIISFNVAFSKKFKSLDICSAHSSLKLYVEYGDSGEVVANYQNNLFERKPQGKCSLELITCPSCLIHIKFTSLNISRSCSNSSGLNCGCDYLLLYQPLFENISGEYFCGNDNDTISDFFYDSKTRVTYIDFVFSRDYGQAFTLEFSALRNQMIFQGYPSINNSSQILTSPFFPHPYPSDLSIEYVIQCHSKEICQISLLFTDFLMADSSILEFFDWNGQRIYVISGNTFRPPVIVTSGPSLTLRFYANGASNMGFKATYFFNLKNFDDAFLYPNTDCGGQVNNLGGGITMMKMINEGTKLYDCIWIVKTPNNFLHRKTHLYVKVVEFADFAGTTELILRKGLTSDEPIIETLKYPLTNFDKKSENEHVVPINEGFYIRLRGRFSHDSRVAIVYAAFNYKDCFSGLDFLCGNLRCISTLLNCDGFDHCGDNSDESPDCYQESKDRRDFAKIPNFLFPKVEPYADLTMATIVFLLCTFGLIGIIFTMALLLYRVNTRARHQRQIQDHLQTIHAILDFNVEETILSDAEEEIIMQDDPPDYEPPPEYSDICKCVKRQMWDQKQKLLPQSSANIKMQSHSAIASCSHIKSFSSGKIEQCLCGFGKDKGCQTSPFIVPDSPPPVYEGNNQNIRPNFNEVDNQGTGSGSLNDRSVTLRKMEEFLKKQAINMCDILKRNIVGKMNLSDECLVSFKQIDKGTQYFGLKRSFSTGDLKFS
ncbi:hypothetical protein ABEB36_009082 [Hypothenemus hampei]|uniref:CUB domain-containing protein n=1 Tax=Hypothenemus hampei TaxID=57062 RepID=A0ABD1EP37_HYPHA